MDGFGLLKVHGTRKFEQFGGNKLQRDKRTIKISESEQEKFQNTLIVTK